jgi:hypothetical protein
MVVPKSINMLNYPIKNFKYGNIDNIEAQSIPDGAMSDSLNFLTLGDKIELSRGSKIIGTTQVGVSKITGLFIATMFDGTLRKYCKRGKKLMYYDDSLATPDWVEVGTDIFGTGGENEDVLFAEYHPTAGDQLWFSTPNSSLFKIMLANPTSYTDMYDSSKNFKGYIKIKYNRMFLVGRDSDKSGVYGSYIDAQSYTTVTGEAVAGSGATRTGTLAFKAGGAKRTCFAVTFTDGVETFSDNNDGTLTGSAGGTGTINYTSGAYSITFAVAPGAPVTSTYQWEDSTNTGIADFTKSSPRTAGQGFVFAQDNGGNIINFHSYDDTEYCLHERVAWALILTADDTNATNLPYREKLGVASLRCSVATDKGIFYIDTYNNVKPLFKLLTLESQSTKVIPMVVTLNVNFEDYRFDDGCMEEWGDYIIILCRHKDSTANNRMFLYHKTWKSIDVRDYQMRCLAVCDGALWGGDALTQNIWELFSGFDDDDSLISGYAIGNITSLSLERLKKCKKFVVEGEIQPNQSFDIYLNPDRTGFTKVYSISGTGDYVDLGSSVNVGTNTLGSKEVGGGSDSVTAYHYKKEFKLALDKFNEIQYKIVPTGIGYLSVSMLEYRDIRRKSNKITSKYRATV